ncbi:putative DNA (cytosine-5-)-methyltransferase [Rosa chinensis]|uniref:Putative DNA (Cytosine-5-)-methyltransferase n=1 Tax=Rosa chinensis TaxID=74649 RepID=A0A2P6S976_ROSCH|nr:DNA (cytosine-5)-methyltransferase DRM2 [Rosa chinensis]PRQ55237.1 putative DNA (cytosine-5-)-methyltransferase [Rosa chinensis]
MKALKDHDKDETPPESVHRYVLYECRRWNLVWVGKKNVAPLEPDEVEMLLGFSRDHTRGLSRTDRHKSLGNSFQIQTVAFHLSVLKDRFPNGINVFSLLWDCWCRNSSLSGWYPNEECCVSGDFRCE